MDAWPRERTYMRDVDYSREGIAASRGPIRTLIDERIFEGRERAQAVAEYVADRHDAFFFLKSDDFATEYEYRVVLGERFPEWQRLAAIAACSDLALKLGRMHWEHGRPHVFRVR